LTLDGKDGKPDCHGESWFHRPKPRGVWLPFVPFLTLAAIPWFVPLLRRLAEVSGK